MMKLFRWAAWVLGWISVLTSPSLIAQEALPIPEPPFQGTADIDARRSTPAWDPAVTAPQGAPNIVLILVDDVGFSATSAFGGPIETPAFAALAKSEEHTSELQSTIHLVCRLLLENRITHSAGTDLRGPGPLEPARVHAE